MTTLYAYWDTRNDMVVPRTVSFSLGSSKSFLEEIVGERYAQELVADGKLFITEIKVERVV